MKLVKGDDFEPSCTIKMDKEIQKFGEFVAVCFDPATDEHMLYNFADTLTVGIAFRMIAAMFDEMYDNETDEQKKILDEYFEKADAN